VVALALVLVLVVPVMVMAVEATLALSDSMGEDRIMMTASRALCLSCVVSSRARASRPTSMHSSPN